MILKNHLGDGWGVREKHALSFSRKNYMDYNGTPLKGTIMIQIIIIAFSIGALVGTVGSYFATKDKIDRIKTDAKKAQDVTADEFYATGYFRGYKDKTARKSLLQKTDTQIIPLIFQ